MNTPKATTDYAAFSALDIRVGTIVSVEDAATKKPTYRLRVDFGPEIGVKTSCGAYRAYAPQELLGKQVIGVVNFQTKKMGPEVSEALILGAPLGLDVVYLTTERPVENGSVIF